MDDLTSIMDDLKQGQRRSNLEDLKLERAPTPEQAVGYMLMRSPNESNRDYRYNFDPLENLYMKKLVSERVLENRIIMDADDYFKGIVFLDYYANVIRGSTSFLSDMYEIAQQLEGLRQDLDPDLKLIVTYTSISYISQFQMPMRSQNTTSSAIRRHESLNTIISDPYISLREIDPTYSSLASMVCSQFQDERIKGMIPNATGAYDLKALMFTDALLPYIESKELVYHRLEINEYAKAAMRALALAAKELSYDTMNEYIERLGGS